MTDGNVASDGAAVPDLIGTVALLLNVAAVIALAMCVAGVGLARPGWAAVAAGITLLSFAASMACFRVHNRRPQTAPAASDGLALES
ncbi:MAG: hypothetical protein JO152_15235 [Mycobacteriaceae bacterium]|nr:hypothetical protein [Mycobacteriaceae bacterium]